MIKDKHFVIDFDSTFTRVEALDILGEISLKDHPEREERLQKIKEYTDSAMAGQITFRESLSGRLTILEANKKHLTKLVEILRQKVSTSFKRNKVFFETYHDYVYIISNGFKEFITPIVLEYGVKEKNVYANTFLYNDKGDIIGFDEQNVLSNSKGKVQVIKDLELDGDVFVIGDGYNDYEIKEAGLANKFYAFTENVERESVLKNADHVTPSLDEFLYLNKINQAISYPKNRINVLLLENIHPRAVEIMKEEGYNVEVYSGGMDEDELAQKIENISILGIRSKTLVTKKVLDKANRLMLIGAFCIGTNQIDLETCLEKGIAVFNAPFSNTRSVVELAIAEIILLMRSIPDKSADMHRGKWSKSATSSYEVRGKKLGIVGYGNIGAQLSVLAESFGMDVYYYDIVEKLALGNATKCNTLHELLSISDIVSLHVDGRPENKCLIARKEFEVMKDNAIFINLSRGHVVDLEVLRENIDSGKILGTAIDVFPEEPKTNDEPFESVMRGARNTLLSPHVGGSTQEAQKNIAEFVPGRIIEYINTGSSFNSVNFPNLQLPAFENAHRLIHIHRNVPGILAHINIVLAEHNINILGQHLKTNERIGYVITDIDKEYDRELISALKKIENTIKFRVLY
ncbi:MAG: phosphoglycerate dehydrogenase [Cyclobacteriaceae bacterium]|nr:phosphoglycerate dehydrogenase [Cyclobacteriaceae bacterium]